MNKEQQTNYIADTNKMVTAVEWFWIHLKDSISKEYFDLFQQAKAMEKEQIENAFQLGKWNGYESAKDISEMKDPTEYYNETYEK